MFLNEYEIKINSNLSNYYIINYMITVNQIQKEKQIKQHKQQ